jgi:Uma2 family endonuclease
MGTSVLVPIEEYLRTAYDPDREYVDGVLVERNVGEYHHSAVQALIAGYFLLLRQRYGQNWLALTEQRTRTRQGNDDQRRYRIPDVQVLAPGHRRSSVTIDPPLIAVEILSPEDSLKATVSKCAEYVELGTPHVWIVDPRARRVYTVGENGATEVPSLSVPFTCNCQTYEFPFAEMFAEMDQD